MYEEYLNKKYNEWTIISFSHKDKNKRPFFNCICSCGNKNKIDLFSLKYGKTKSCRSCSAKKRENKHNLSYSRIYRIFNHMKQRCKNKNDPAYKYYGERGIKICKEWENNFISFYDWAIKNGYREDLTIDRIDNNKGYFPENCRWVDMKAQQNNKKNNHIIKYKDKEYTISKFCKFFNLNERTIRQRINIYGYEKAEDLLKKNLYGIKNRKYIATINGITKTVCEWCEDFDLNKNTIYNRIKKYGYTPEEALTKKLKNGKSNPFLIY